MKKYGQIRYLVVVIVVGVRVFCASFTVNCISHESQLRATRD